MNRRNTIFFSRKQKLTQVPQPTAWDGARVPVNEEPVVHPGRFRALGPSVLLIALSALGAAGAASLMLGTGEISGIELLVIFLCVSYLIRTAIQVAAWPSRPIGWWEAVGVGVWVSLLFCVLALAAGDGNPSSAGTSIGAILYAVGFVSHPVAEAQRHRWRSHPAHHGRLYTGGAFRYCRHPNYLADILLFTGLAVVTGTWWRHRCL